MLYKRNKEAELKRELFENPTSEYRGTPFWSWNCRITKELIHDQVEVFRKMGFGGAHLHPRTGLETDYLSEEFMEMVRYSDEEMKKKEMLCWLYDEDRYPSGAAGGIVTENLNYRARYLLLTRERKNGMCASGEEFRKKAVAGEKSRGYYLCAYRIKLEDGYLWSYKKIDGPCPETDSCEEEQAEGKLWLAYVELMPESPWFNDQTYIDVMNKEAVKRFLEVTHERYAEKLGDEFGKSIPAIFTDEPQMKGSMALSDGDCEEDVTLSFTDDLPETYEAAYGKNLLEVVPELLWEMPGGVHGAYSVHRWRYHNHLTERFVTAFCDTIADWCEAHKLAMTGHYMSEPTLYSQTLRLGEAMRCYRKQQLPGVDILCGDPEYSTIKQASSVARQYKREGVTCELYGVNHWDLDFKGHKVQGDWQAALGVTIRVPHLAFMSMEGEAKRDWPASISYQSPWWEKYGYIENYFARVNTALTRGKAHVNVAVIHPIESYWISYGTVQQTGETRNQMDSNFKNIIDWLLFGLTDFDFISESLLPDQYNGVVRGKEKKLKVGEMAYKTVLLPDLLTIRGTTVEILEEFAKNGGQVVFLGRVPLLVDGVPSDRARRLAQEAMQVPFQKEEVLKAVEQQREIDVRMENGGRSENLFYQMREDGENRWLFLCHVNRKRNRVDLGERMKICLRGYFRIESYNAMDGSVSQVEVSFSRGMTEAEVIMYAEDSLLWKLIPAKATEAAETENRSGTAEVTGSFYIKTGICAGTYGLVATPKKEKKQADAVLTTIYEPKTYRLAEPDVLLLDKAQWRLDNGDWNPRQEILRLDNEIRTILHHPHRQDAYTQPWRIKEAPENNTVELLYEIDSEIDMESLELAMERPEKAVIRFNGAVQPSSESSGYYVDSFIRRIPLHGLKKGRNELRLVIPYGRKTNLENLYLLGDFGVEVRGTHAVLTEKTRKLYFGDITRQKMPFYGGSIIYSMEFKLDKTQKASVRIPHFSAPVIGVKVDGRDMGLIAFAPHMLALGEVAAGCHSLELYVYGNRFNSFGTLHNSNDEFKWYGPDSYRTSGYEWTEGWALRPFGILSRVEIVGESGGQQ